MHRDYKLDIFEAVIRVTDEVAKTHHDPGEETPSSFCVMMGHNKKWYLMIYLKNDCPRTACHESVHAAVELLAEIGVKYDRDNHEILAWTTDFIFGKCMEFLEAKQAAEAETPPTRSWWELLTH